MSLHLPMCFLWICHFFFFLFFVLIKTWLTEHFLCITGVASTRWSCPLEVDLGAGVVAGGAEVVVAGARVVFAGSRAEVAGDVAAVAGC